MSLKKKLTRQRQHQIDSHQSRSTTTIELRTEPQLRTKNCPDEPDVVSSLLPSLIKRLQERLIVDVVLVELHRDGLWLSHEDRQLQRSTHGKPHL